MYASLSCIWVIPYQVDQHLEVNLSNFLELFCASVFRIWSDPYHLAGSGSESGNVDLDPGTKTKS